MVENSAKYVDGLVDEDEVPELTPQDFQQMTAFAELPQDQQEFLLRLRDEPVEIRHTVALAPEVVAGFRARGENWQKAMDMVLRDWLHDYAA